MANQNIGETIIPEFKNGDPAALLAYQKICKAVDSFEQWPPEHIEEFLNQFINISSLLDAKCRVFVEKLALVKWYVIPVVIRQRFVDMLRKLAVQYVCHTEVLLSSFTSNMVPPVKPVVEVEACADSVSASPSVGKVKNELLLSVEEQEDIYQLSHDSVKCAKLLGKAIRRNFPFFKVCSLGYTAYIKNLLIIYEYAADLRGDIWKMLLESLALLDSAVSRKAAILKTEGAEDKNGNETYDVFFMDEDKELKEKMLVEEQELQQTLDMSMLYILAFIAKAHNKEIPARVDFPVPFECNRNTREGMYLCFRSAFETDVLVVTGLKCLPFLMFYFISLDKKYLTNFTEWLWSFIIFPSQSPNDWKKAHAAACYLGNLLAKAKFVDLKLCCTWMEHFVNWCTKYVNETIGGSAGASAGTLRHGTFYAVFQALLVAFIYRYSEITANNGLEAVRRWGLGHIVHCALQPLVYISPVVASSFASISRSLQLVYCNHMLPLVYERVNMPFEPFFPFQSYFLVRTSSFISDLTLHFCPLSENEGEVWQRNNSRLNPSSFQGGEAGSLEFLEDLKRDRDMENEESSRIWPIADSRRFDYPLAKITSPSAAPIFITSSSLMDVM